LPGKSVGDYKINSTFETASGTTNVEIGKAKSNPFVIIAAAVGIIVIAILLIFLIFNG
jgi:hypothetical protein